MNATYEQLLAVFEAAGSNNARRSDSPWELPTPLVDHW